MSEEEKTMRVSLIFYSLIIIGREKGCEIDTSTRLTRCLWINRKCVLVSDKIRVGRNNHEPFDYYNLKAIFRDRE